MFSLSIASVPLQLPFTRFARRVSSRHQMALRAIRGTLPLALPEVFEPKML
jgi:hypothetical protein